MVIRDSVENVKFTVFDIDGAAAAGTAAAHRRATAEIAAAEPRKPRSGKREHHLPSGHVSCGSTSSPSF
jgi:hypothetical protein